jgi:hypothetical protein
MDAGKNRFYVADWQRELKAFYQWWRGPAGTPVPPLLTLAVPFRH